MALLSPSPNTDQDRDALIETLRQLIGCRITEARYLVPSTSERTTADRSRGFDQVDMGIELDLSDNRTFVAAWEMKGYCEGLAFGVFPSDGYTRPERVKPIAVAGADEWQARFASTIASVGLAWHVPDERCPETIWSVRICLDDADLVIALGEEKESGRIGYQPDSLVVLFDRLIANSYEIPASDRTAWGSDV